MLAAMLGPMSRDPQLENVSTSLLSKIEGSTIHRHFINLSRVVHYGSVSQ